MVNWFLCLALNLCAIPVAPSSQVEWQQNYTTAKEMAATRKRPMAVIVGEGKDGWKSLAAEGTNSGFLEKTLKDNFVCLYVDSTTEEGKQLAKAFQIENQGLVISSNDGKLQAFRHSGVMQPAEASLVLQKFTNVAAPATTETLATSLTTTATPTATCVMGSCQSGACSSTANCSTATVTTTAVTSSCSTGNCPQTVIISPSVSTSSCPTGQCPNRPTTVVVPAGTIVNPTVVTPASPTTSSCPNGQCPKTVTTYIIR